MREVEVDLMGRIAVDRGTCLGNGLCVGYAPQFFELDDSDVAVVKGSPTEDDVAEALRACPAQAIHVLED